MAPIEVSKLLGTAGAVVLLAACPDPAGVYEAFLGRTEDVRQAPGNTQLGCPGITDISGDWLLFFSVSGPLGGGDAIVPLYLRAEIENFVATADGATFDLDMIPLSVSGGGGCAPTWNPTSQVITKKGVPVDACGIFTVHFDTLDIDGCANPLSGSQISAIPITMTGATLSAERFCGYLKGEIVSPIRGFFDPGTDLFAAEPTVPTPAELAMRFPSAFGGRPVVACETGGGGAGGGGGDGGGGAGGDGAGGAGGDGAGGAGGS